MRHPSAADSIILNGEIAEKFVTQFKLVLQKEILRLNLK